MSNLNEINKNRELSISEKNKKERLKKALKKNMSRRKQQTQSRKIIKTSKEKVFIIKWVTFYCRILQDNLDMTWTQGDKIKKIYLYDLFNYKYQLKHS